MEVQDSLLKKVRLDDIGLQDRGSRAIAEEADLMVRLSFGADNRPE